MLNTYFLSTKCLLLWLQFKVLDMKVFYQLSMFLLNVFISIIELKIRFSYLYLSQNCLILLWLTKWLTKESTFHNRQSISYTHFLSNFNRHNVLLWKSEYNFIITMYTLRNIFKYNNKIVQYSYSDSFYNFFKE